MLVGNPREPITTTRSPQCRHSRQLNTQGPIRGRCPSTQHVTTTRISLWKACIGRRRNQRYWKGHCFQFSAPWSCQCDCCWSKHSNYCPGTRSHPIECIAPKPTTNFDKGVLSRLIHNVRCSLAGRDPPRRAVSCGWQRNHTSPI